MRAIIVDDESHNIENLGGILNRHFPEVDIVATADHKQAAIESILATSPDLLFLDIQMGATTGFDILKNLPSRDFEIIFVTAYDQYGIQAIKYAALDYILKPIDIEELSSALLKAKEKISLKKKNQQVDFLVNFLQGQKMPSRIALPQLHEVRYVEVAHIVRCEAQNSYTWFFLLSGDKILVSKSLREYEELLTQHHFIRCHQTHLINPVHVKSYLTEDGGTLLLQDGVKIPVSKTKKEAVKKALT